MGASTVGTLGGIASQHWGLLTTREAEDAGVGRLQLSRLAKSGAIERVDHGIYRMAGAPPQEHEQMLAAWLVLDGEGFRPGTQPAATLAGVAAARMHQIGEFWIDRIDFITPKRRTTRRDDIHLRTGALTRDEWTLVDGLPVLTVERTLADLIAAWTDESLVAAALAEAHARGEVNLDLLRRHLDPIAAAHGVQSGSEQLHRLVTVAGIGTGPR